MSGLNLASGLSLYTVQLYHILFFLHYLVTPFLSTGLLIYGVIDSVSDLKHLAECFSSAVCIVAAAMELVCTLAEEVLQQQSGCFVM